MHGALPLAGCAKKIYKEGGMAALFKGNFATMVKVAPQTAIQFAVGLPTSGVLHAACIVHGHQCRPSWPLSGMCCYGGEGHSSMGRSILSTADVMALSCILQVYDTITDAMYTSLARVEQASGIPQTRQLAKWQHLLAGASSTQQHPARLTWAIPSCLLQLSAAVASPRLRDIARLA